MISTSSQLIDYQKPKKNHLLQIKMENKQKHFVYRTK